MSPAGIKECERGESRCGHEINGQRHVSGIVAKNIASGDQHGNFFPSNRKPQLQLHVSVGFGGRSEVWRAPYLAIPGPPPLLELSFASFGLIIKTGFRVNARVINPLLKGLCDAKRVGEAMEILS